MKPPVFLWKSGTLDAFDSVEEFEDRYPPDTLAGQDFIACDSEGRILVAGRASDRSRVLSCDELGPPSPDTLRNILRRVRPGSELHVARRSRVPFPRGPDREGISSDHPRISG